ncbi:hypothetical protein BGZ88_001432 [Linnemannia elongata]|nr:hypothetical protein BGZ88_001432 [Linnemannia elongata]
MSVAVMYKGEVIFAEGFGKRNEHQPFTNRRIRSTTEKDESINHPPKIAANGGAVMVKILNVMYAVVGEVAANVAGTTYEQLVHDKVITPLGLSNTGFSQKAMKKLENHASPYHADSFSKAQAGEFRKGEYDEIYMAFAPAGDLHSNVLDLLKWGKVIVDGGKVKGGKQVLSKESVEMTVTPQTGAYPGSSANLRVFPDDDLIIAQLRSINSSALGVYTDFFIADKILNLPTYSTGEDWLFDKAVKATAEIYEDLEKDREGKGLSTRVEETVSVLPREDMVGRFANPLYGVITIARVIPDKDEGKDEEEEGLEFSYNEYRCKMEHYHYETFKVVLEDLGVFEAKLVSFEAGSDGHVARLSINFEEPDLVRFVRVKTSIATTVADKEEQLMKK